MAIQVLDDLHRRLVDPFQVREISVNLMSEALLISLIWVVCKLRNTIADRFIIWAMVHYGYGSHDDISFVGGVLGKAVYDDIRVG